MRSCGVPYRFARSEVEVRLTGRTLEIFVRAEEQRRSASTRGQRRSATARRPESKA
jgi:hypothetical protein